MTRFAAVTGESGICSTHRLGSRTWSRKKTKAALWESDLVARLLSRSANESRKVTELYFFGYPNRHTSLSSVLFTGEVKLFFVDAAENGPLKALKTIECCLLSSGVAWMKNRLSAGGDLADETMAACANARSFRMLKEKLLQAVVLFFLQRSEIWITFFHIIFIAAPRSETVRKRR